MLSKNFDSKHARMRSEIDRKYVLEHAQSRENGGVQKVYICSFLSWPPILDIITHTYYRIQPCVAGIQENLNRGVYPVHEATSV